MPSEPNSRLKRPFTPVGEMRGEVKLSDRIAREFEERIVAGELPPGERLPTESELCELLDVSRSVIRDAVRTLTARGLVEVRQGRGTIVTSPDDSAYSDALALLLTRSDLTMGDIFDARRALETQLGMLAVNSRTEDDLEALESSYDALVEAISERDWQRASDGHLEFHTSLIHAVHLPAVEKLLEPMQQLVVPSAAPPIGVDDLWDTPAHPPIIKALRKKDSSAMERALKGHYRRSRDSAEDAWLQLPFREAAVLSRENLARRAG
ncbi:MAG: GntR family transcriptional regulator [Solirubrobacterales bacterium]